MADSPKRPATRPSAARTATVTASWPRVMPSSRSRWRPRPRGALDPAEVAELGDAAVPRRPPGQENTGEDERPRAGAKHRARPRERPHGQDERRRREQPPRLALDRAREEREAQQRRDDRRLG